MKRENLKTIAIRFVAVKARCTACAFVSLLIAFACFAQAATDVPRDWELAGHILVGLEPRGVELSHNSQASLRQEILDTNTLRLIAQPRSLTDADAAALRIEPGFDSNWLTVYRRGKSAKASNLISEELSNYVRERQAGHTRGFVLATLTNRVVPSTISDPDLRTLATHQTNLLLSWVRKVDSGTGTNEAGRVARYTISTTVIDGKSVTNEVVHIPKTNEVWRWVQYALVDGEVAWLYYLTFDPVGSFDDVSEHKCDAKEYDPIYRDVLKTVEDEAHEEMKRMGILGRFGSVHTFWRLKQEKLKARGIEWRSPAELNRNTNYD